VTLNQGMKMRSWYDILGLDRTSQQDTEGIRSAERSILALIDEQIQQGIPSSKIFIAGFSQGGAMALHTGLRYPEKLAGIIALSTYLPLADLVEIERHSSNHETPIFYAHGHYDEILPEDFATSSCATLRTLDYFVELKLYPMGHTVCIEELKDLSAFIVKHAIKPLT